MVLGKKLAAAALGLSLAGAGVMAAPGSAKAWVRWGVGIALPPVVVAPPPVYYPPPPVYYAPPPPVYYVPPPPRRVWVPAHWWRGVWVAGHWA
ncbi:MAG TPA: hypothetical protein VFA03_11515 [Acetobacteraceae bacterium]|nr:hypothetical protein [Acetobacteraceae bacterium]